MKSIVYNIFKFQSICNGAHAVTKELLTFSPITAYFFNNSMIYYTLLLKSEKPITAV
jgi:hypothetical protein